MYYEEKLIDGILHWRGTPDGEWQIVPPAEKLAERAADANLAFGAPLAELRAQAGAERMTEQQQREACAELARRMGWTLESDGHWQSWRSPDGGTRRNVRPSHDEFPVGNFFTDPAASRELVMWIFAQPYDVSRYFVAEVLQRLWPDSSIFISSVQVDIHMIRDLLTVPLPVIARAACKALGIATED